MSTIKSLALLGFLPDVESKLKELIQQHISQDIEWVTATDASLQGVVINADFISTPQIQKYIQRITANIVCCYRDADSKAEAEKHQVVGMDLVYYEEKHLQQWLSELFGEVIVLDKSDSHSSDRAEKPRKFFDLNNVSSSSAQKTTQKTTPKTARLADRLSDTKKNEDKTASRRAKSPFEKNTQTPSINRMAVTSPLSTNESKLNFNHEYNLLLAKLQQSEGFYLIQYGDKSVWVDVMKSEVWLDFDRDQIPSIETVRWAGLENLDGKGEARRLQLELWLFETLWQSTNVHSDKVSDSGLYKLFRWPRPLCSHGRSEALRLAAFIQSSAASPAQLCAKTGYDDVMVKRFLSATIIAGQVKQTGIVQEDALSATPTKPVDNVKLGLIGRLRSKLGL